ncbi:MAG: hypothetical protein ACLT0Z_11060 [Gemmiger sp.]
MTSDPYLIDMDTARSWCTWPQAGLQRFLVGAYKLCSAMVGASHDIIYTNWVEKPATV